MKEQKIRINLLYYPVLTLGPFDRVGLWLQGCSIKCKGCMSRHTWSFNGGHSINIDDLVEKILKYRCKRLTVSGGEPLDQYEQTVVLLEKLRKHMEDILLYTGYDIKIILEKFREITELVDVIVAGPYVENLPSQSKLKGSENQQVVFFNQSLETSYRDYDKSPRIAQRLEVGGMTYTVGVPERWTV